MRVAVTNANNYIMRVDLHNSPKGKDRHAALKCMFSPDKKLINLFNS